MKDCKNKELNVGDFVAYVQGKNTSASIATGNVTRIYQGRYGEECSVDGNAHILKNRVLKLPNTLKSMD